MRPARIVPDLREPDGRDAYDEPALRCDGINSDYARRPAIV
jgi:hypothetical protein